MERLENEFNSPYIQKPAVPDYIIDNLAFELRPYQNEAISRFLLYRDIERENKQRHLLWQMATGSGKTLIMASLILELYKQGYRNFLFFVNSTNILEKTFDNFSNSASKKYQFASRIEIDGQNIEINIVENFEATNKNAININFLTIQKLHGDLLNCKENAITPEDLQDKEIVMIADEAHHLNSMTAKGEKEVETSWENTVQSILNQNCRNILLEFTATIDWSDTKIANKYCNKILFNYDLKEFRKDKYSKDVFTFAVDNDIENRILQAIIISQYRKHIANDNLIFLKPVVLFRSKSIKESGEHFENFKNLIANFNQQKLENLFVTTNTDGANIWSKAVAYFQSNIAGLVSDLKQDFREEYCLLINSKDIATGDQQKLNTLENTDNPIRAIFAVDMLKEGWDVLNLFDIVRLYESRDGKWKTKNGKKIYEAGKTTISEQQLIGRGARYYPFIYKSEDRFKRKFDNNEAEPLRVIEQMHYHCKNDPKYISEIKATLIESGIIAGDDLFECTTKLKDQYKKDKNSVFSCKNIYTNTILTKKNWTTNDMIVVESEELKEQGIVELPNYENDEIEEIRLSTGEIVEKGVFTNYDSSMIDFKFKTENVQIILEKIPTNIIRHALNCNQNFCFNKLKAAYPKLESTSQFISLLSKKKINVNLPTNITNEIYLQIIKQVLSKIEIGIKDEQKKVYVTKHFQPYIVSDKFEEYIVRKTNERPISQNDDNNYQLDLSKCDWYVYNDNFGTSEEKAFVKWFSDNFMTKKSSGKTELEEKGWTEIYLARNEKAVKLYSWYKQNLGEGFEPDFVLFATKDNLDYVFYIEPKGDWTYNEKEKDFGKEQWKEDFLLEIDKVASEQRKKMSDTPKWRLIGLPFYNENHTKDDFKEAIEEIINKA
ncbi:MAG: DEAD/DEAH box helicase family protein [Bacteroidales bacterium]|jgi:type III restriction enzyme|nr:DEAD/DEAH box helicase family protein [Bacteroidales bacterium]